jgi:cardiolipin synthase
LDDRISLEAYIFEPGEIGKMFIDALAERAQAGVRVHVVTDAVGSIKLSAKDLEPLTESRRTTRVLHAAALVHVAEDG